MFNKLLGFIATLLFVASAQAQTLTVTSSCHITAPATTCPITVDWDAGTPGFLRYGVYAIVSDQCTGLLTASEPGDQVICGSAMLGMNKGSHTFNFRTSAVGCARVLHFSLYGTNKTCAGPPGTALVTGIAGSSTVWNP